MRLVRLLPLTTALAAVVAASSISIEKRDADFYSVRTQQALDSRKDEPPSKYFHESTFHDHYDGRFADHTLDRDEKSRALSNLMQTYLSTMVEIRVETWLMHGSLLGWWWNRRILPWYPDSDVQVTEHSIHYLASYYNMSTFYYKTPRIPEGRGYMLEINPHYVIRDESDWMNVIDGRWIDTESGLFIDIKAARYNESHPEGPNVLTYKDGNQYRDTYIFPLLETTFEGAPVKIPFAYKALLEAEYGEKALSSTRFNGYRFDDNDLKWIPV